MDFSTARKVALSLPGVEESTAYGASAFKVGGKMIACVATNKSAEPGSLVVRIGKEARAELLAEAPDVYYVTDHYVNYPAMLVRLSRVDPDALKDLLLGAIRFMGTKAPAKRRSAPKKH